MGIGDKKVFFSSLKIPKKRITDINKKQLP
jgi:hypothetical protein